ncbi:hypothetical protein BGZ94_009945 [Podila epigama]|nr:hypothetical protein BGZ94_009945 [Podila epigama]
MDQDRHIDTLYRSDDIESDEDSSDDHVLPPSYEEAISQYATEEPGTLLHSTSTLRQRDGHHSHSRSDGHSSQSHIQSHSQSRDLGQNHHSEPPYSENDTSSSSSRNNNNNNTNEDQVFRAQESSRSIDDEDDEPSNQVPSTRSTQTFVQPRSGTIDHHHHHHRRGSLNQSGHHEHHVHGHGPGHRHEHGHGHGPAHGLGQGPPQGLPHGPDHGLGHGPGHALGHGPLVPPAAIPTAAGLLSSQEISTAEFSKTKKGVESNDPMLEDPFQLYRFFVAHNDRPSMHVLITGSHREIRKVGDHRKEDSEDGTPSTSASASASAAVTQIVKVNDFKMVFDLTPYISPSGTIMALSDTKTGKSRTLREVMEEHVEEDSPFKEIHMDKTVNWDFEDLTRSITHAIRSVNYRYTIEISYPIGNHQVVVHSSSALANFMRSAWTKTFCYMSCVGLVFYPLRNYFKKVNDTSLRSEFQMTISTREFYHHNYWNIIEQVHFKTK